MIDHDYKLQCIADLNKLIENVTAQATAAKLKAVFYDKERANTEIFMPEGPDKLEALNHFEAQARGARVAAARANELIKLHCTEVKELQNMVEN